MVKSCYVTHWLKFLFLLNLSFSVSGNIFHLMQEIHQNINILRKSIKINFKLKLGAFRNFVYFISYLQTQVKRCYAMFFEPQMLGTYKVLSLFNKRLKSYDSSYFTPLSLKLIAYIFTSSNAMNINWSILN